MPEVGQAASETQREIIPPSGIILLLAYHFLGFVAAFTGSFSIKSSLSSGLSL